MNTKDLGVMLGGVAAVMGLAYARSKMSGSLAEFSTPRGERVERALKLYGEQAQRHYDNLHTPGADSASSRQALLDAYRELLGAAGGATVNERYEYRSKLPKLQTNVPQLLVVKYDPWYDKGIPTGTPIPRDLNYMDIAAVVWARGLYRKV